MNRTTKVAYEFLMRVINLFVRSITKLPIEVKLEKWSLCYVIFLRCHGINARVNLGDLENAKGECVVSKMLDLGHPNPSLYDAMTISYAIENNFDRPAKFYRDAIREKIDRLKALIELKKIDPRGYKPEMFNFNTEIEVKDLNAKTFREAFQLGMNFTEEFYYMNKYHVVMMFDHCYNRISDGAKAHLEYLAYRIEDPYTLELAGRMVYVASSKRFAGETILENMRIANEDGILGDVLMKYFHDFKNFPLQFVFKIIEEPLSSWDKYFDDYHNVLENVKHTVRKYRRETGLPQELITENFILKQDDDMFLQWSRAANRKFCTSRGYYSEDISVFRYCLADRNDPNLPVGIVIANEKGIVEIGYKRYSSSEDVPCKIKDEIHKKILALGFNRDEIIYDHYSLSEFRRFVENNWDKFSTKEEMVKHLDHILQEGDLN